MGDPTPVNAHPHSDCAGAISVVHSCVVENFLTLKKELLERGHITASSTYSESVAPLVGGASEEWR